MTPPTPAPLSGDDPETRASDGGGPGAQQVRPAVSIILPVYNTAAHVGAAIDSLKEQTFSDFEAIIVDDGSTDGSAAQARAAAGDDPRFRFLSQPNRGLSAARNAGLAKARGPIIGFLDSDDRFAPEFLQRMIAAMDQTAAPWVASAVRVVSPAGDRLVSAIHGCLYPAAPGVGTIDLTDWREIVPIWPSAWNKLYRRDLIGDLTFAEGLRYEDHPWFQALADRAEILAYVPEPLYLHRQGRAHQITGDGSDRVFDQFDALELCAGILRASSKPGAGIALGRIGTRVVHERASVIRDPARRWRFLQVAQSFFDQHGLAWSPEWDRDISRSWELVMAGRLPLTVVVPVDRAGPALQRTLTALSRQHFLDFETLIVQSSPGAEAHAALLKAARTLPGASVLAASAAHAAGGLAGARNRGLAAASGEFVVFLDAGDRIAPRGLWTWVEGMLREDADLGLSRFRTGEGSEVLHSGCHRGASPFGTDPPEIPGGGQTPPDWLALMEGTAGPLPPDRALALHAHPSAKIFRTAFLRENGMDFPPEPLSSWDLVVRAALRAERVLSIPSAAAMISTDPKDRRLWRSVQAPVDLRVSILRLAPELDRRMPRVSWYPVLLARAIWEKLNFAQFPNDAARAAFLEEARRVCADVGASLDQDALDPHIGPRVRALFRLDQTVP